MIARKLKEGTYRGVLFLDEKQQTELPFNFELIYKGKRPSFIFMNGDERIPVDDINVRGDSLSFKMPVFDTEFKLLVVKDGFEGVWINNYRSTKNRLNFKATFGETRRFISDQTHTASSLEGRWLAHFSPGSIDSSASVAVFHHVEQTNIVTGTFLTSTGDYRYLEGILTDDKLYLSAFDGSHAFLFQGELKGDEIVNGVFYSGTHWRENWSATRNPLASLPDPENITYVKGNTLPVQFTFPDLNGIPVSLADKKYTNKAVIIQLMGSWCPNCMDESRFLASIYREFNKEGLEIIALAFEKTADQQRSQQQLTRMASRLGVEYSVLITGKITKQEASEILPMLNAVIAFPTTIFLDRNHKIVKVHTGFSGPATGKPYDEFKNETRTLINTLLK